MKRRIGFIVGIVVVLLVLWAVVGKHGADTKGRKRAGPLRVETVQAVIKPMPVQLEVVGQVEPENSVQVRAQVSGVIRKIGFTEGATVKPGQVLFEIDSAQLRAAVAQARAALARDTSAASRAEWQAQQLAPLAKLEYVTRKEYEDAVAAAKESQAAIAADQAVVEQAKIQLSYATIRAPIGGHTGVVAVKVGDLVQANGSTPLVTINQIAPIRVRFSVAQDKLAAIRKHLDAGEVQVRVQRTAPGGETPVPGHLVFVDNTVDPATGTVVLKAELPNRRHLLWPGEYVTLDVILTVQKDAVVIPDSAVQSGQDGTYVFVVAKGHASVRPVTVDRQLNGLSVIATGLKAGEAVAAKIPRNLRDGSAVTAVADDAGGKAAGSKHSPAAASQTP